MLQADPDECSSKIDPPASYPIQALFHPYRLLASTDLQECEHCGGYCPWDAESEWQEKWNDWESKLAYYDRTYGALMDEW
jgi:hypothetical protein